jgi:hypothetical protein
MSITNYLHCQQDGTVITKTAEMTIVAIDRIPQEDRPGLCGPCLEQEKCTPATFACIHDYGEDGTSISGRCDEHKDVDVYELGF